MFLLLVASGLPPCASFCASRNLYKRMPLAPTAQGVRCRCQLNTTPRRAAWPRVRPQGAVPLQTFAAPNRALPRCPSSSGAWPPSTKPPLPCGMTTSSSPRRAGRGPGCWRLRVHAAISQSTAPGKNIDHRPRSANRKNIDHRRGRCCALFCR